MTTVAEESNPHRVRRPRNRPTSARSRRHCCPPLRIPPVNQNHVGCIGRVNLNMFLNSYNLSRFTC